MMQAVSGGEAGGAARGPERAMVVENRLDGQFGGGARKALIGCKTMKGPKDWSLSGAEEKEQ